MKHAVTAAVALALSLGLAAAAQAHGTYPQRNAATARQQTAMTTQHVRLLRQPTRQAQRLQHRQMRLAMTATRHTRHNILHRTAGLHRKMIDRQSNQAIGVGSSTAPSSPNTGTQMMPPATTPTAGAGNQ